MAILLWIYTLFLVFIWGFFIITKIHAYKFKNFSYHIETVTKFLFVTLIILSLLWYGIIIYYLKWSGNNGISVQKKGYYNTINY
jgi:hypothetical protein